MMIPDIKKRLFDVVSHGASKYESLLKDALLHIEELEREVSAKQDLIDQLLIRIEPLLPVITGMLAARDQKAREGK